MAKSLSQRIESITLLGKINTMDHVFGQSTKHYG